MSTASLSTDTTESTHYTMDMARRQRNPVSVDAFGKFTSDWKIISPEDIFVKRNLKNKVQTAILKVAYSIVQLKSHDIDEDDDGKESKPTANETTSGTYYLPAGSHPDDESAPPALHSSLLRPRYAGSDSDRDSAAIVDYGPSTVHTVDTVRPRAPQNAVEWLEARPYCVSDLLFPVESYHLLQERNWLPESYGNLRLTYELDSNHLIVHLASPAHDAAANAFNFTIVLWSSNGGTGLRALIQLGEGQWRYAPGAEKSPDQSFIPIALTCPPARVIPGTTNCPYPTIVIEVSKTNESYQQLLDDADIKHFSNDTSIQIWVGVKLFPGYGGRMKCMFRLRDQVNGGTLAGSGASTDFIPLNQPTTAQFIIPKARVFWGVNPPLPVTQQTIPGPNAFPPPAIPGVPTDDLVLSLEDLRHDAARCW